MGHTKRVGGTGRLERLFVQEAVLYRRAGEDALERCTSATAEAIRK